MKRSKLYLLVFILGLTLTKQQGFAQGSIYYYQEPDTWELGPRIGFTTSLINSKGNPELEKGIKMGIVGGVFVRYQLGRLWAFHTDLSYSTRGNKSASSNIENSYIDYSIVPVRIVEYGMFKREHAFDFFLGPGVSFLVNSQDKSGNINDLEAKLAPVEFNVVVGGTLALGPVLLTATNRIGVSDLMNASIPGSKWSSFSTEWTIAYRFKIKRD